MPRNNGTARKTWRKHRAALATELNFYLARHWTAGTWTEEIAVGATKGYRRSLADEPGPKPGTSAA